MVEIRDFAWLASVATALIGYRIGRANRVADNTPNIVSTWLSHGDGCSLVLEIENKSSEDMTIIGISHRGSRLSSKYELDSGGSIDPSKTATETHASPFAKHTLIRNKGHLTIGEMFDGPPGSIAPVVIRYRLAAGTIRRGVFKVYYPPK